MTDSKGKKYKIYGKILKQRLNEKDGYFYVVLSFNQKRYTIKTHRLVCTAFHENTDNLPCVNHKDENKLNNCERNLEWCDYLYNANYGTAIFRSAKKRSEILSNQIVQMQKDGQIVKIWESTRKASENGFCKVAINSSIKKNILYHGFVWRRLCDIEISERDIKKYTSAKVIMYSKDYNRQSVVQLSKNGDIIKIWNNKSDLSKFGYCYTGVMKCVKGRAKTSDGYKWGKLSDFNLTDSDIQIYQNAEPPKPQKIH